MSTASSPSLPNTVSLEQYGELEVKVIKLRRALSHAQDVTQRQDTALTKTIDKLQALDQQVKDLKSEGSRLTEEVSNLEDQLAAHKQKRKNEAGSNESKKKAAEREIEKTRKEIQELKFKRAKTLVDIEKQKLSNREIGRTLDIVQKRFEHEEKKRKHEIRKLEDREKLLKKELEKLKKEREVLLKGRAATAGKSIGSSESTLRSEGSKPDDENKGYGKSEASQKKADDNGTTASEDDAD